MTSREKETQLQIEELQKTIGKLQLLNRELKQQATQSDAANKAKSDFLAMISHEIRTPLNGVIGLTEILLDTRLDSKQRHYSNMVLTSARNLLTLINSLLDFSKIEADKMELDIGEFDLKKLVDELIKLYSLTGQGKKLRVYAEIDPRLSGCYLGDSYRIRQILVNLLGNAIKFTDRGSVVLRVTGSGAMTDAGQEVVRFEVEDTGPGIPADKQDQLFIPFSQIDNSTTRRHGGTGLGLAICQKLVSLMDGEIGFESTEGQGSRFWFTLPLRLAGKEPAKKARPRPEPPQYDCRHENERRGPERSSALTSILIVDDDETNCFVLETILQNTSTHIITVENGLEAVRLCESRDFDLIFMDCRMPIMDGFEATAAIRSLTAGKSRKHPVIIALTADVTQATRQHCSAVGMDDCLIKPLDFSRLQNVFDNWLPDAGIRIKIRTHVLPAAVKKSELKTKPTGGQPIDDKVLTELQKNIGDVRPVIRVFLHSLQGRLEQLQQAIIKGESAVVSRVAHTIKGSCSQFGATHLAELCRLAETMGNNKNMANLEIIFKKIKQAAEQVASFLREELDKK